MNRKIIRTSVKLGTIAVLALLAILILDSWYRVLPTSIHNRLPAHHPGLVVTDITIQTCSTLNPFSSCKLDEDEHWHRIEKELYLGKGFLSKAYLHVQRKKEEELLKDEELVFDIKIGRLPPGAAAHTKEERWESRPAGLWIKKSAKRHMSDASKVVTGVDVLFGPDAADPRSNWEVQDIGLLLESHAEAPEARLTVRKGPVLNIDRPIPRIRKDGKFKIMQAADLHLATGFGKCRDALPEGNNGGHCDADIRTLEFVEKMLDEEKPDFIVLSGDQVNGDTAPDSQTAIFKYSALFAKHKIPYAAIFGNHDDEGDLTRSQSMEIMDGLPYSLSTAGPPDVEGVGNYLIEILGRSPTTHSALTLYLLDTHSYSPDEHKYRGYDWVKPSQIDWFRSSIRSLKKKHAEYTHIHMDLAFIHIPLPEYRNPHDLPIVGNMSEPPTAPLFNSGFMSTLIDEGVVMVSCGHDHVNDYCVPGLSEKDGDKGKAKLWMCYGGASGFGGYGGYHGYHRRMRFFDIDMNEARITSYKRMEWGDTKEKIDEQILVDAGRVVVDM
jgi:3',5'-cyclic AMP phosphodiesterase CpdA